MTIKQTVASFLFLLVAVSSFGQDGKPTKEQTVDFIKTNYPKRIGYLASFNDGEAGHIFDGEITDISVGIIGTSVTVRYNDLLKYSFISREEKNLDQEHTREQYVVRFDLKDIEAIRGFTRSLVGFIDYDSAKSGLFPMYLVFVAAGGKPTISVTTNGETRQVSSALVPFSEDDVDESHRVLQEFGNWQLYKAFEHLRKLSGAPEPLRF